MLVSMVKSFQDMFGPFPDMFYFKSLTLDAGSLFVREIKQNFVP